MDGRENWHKKIMMDGRENWHKRIVMYCREQLQKSTLGARGVNPIIGHTTILMGLFGKLKRERAELRDGLLGKVEKVVTDEQKQVEEVVTQKVEKIVKGSRRVDGVLWMHRSHVATRRSHMRQSNMAMQLHLVMHNMHKPCCTVDRRHECETRVLNHEHVCSLSLLSKLTTTVDTAYTGKTRSRLVCLKFLLISRNLSAGKFFV